MTINHSININGTIDNNITMTINSTININGLQSVPRITGLCSAKREKYL
jgi:hypothetical protein